MTPDTVIDIFHHMVLAMMLGVVVLIIPGLVVGLIVAIFQAATQINEATLSFLPKLLVMLAVISLVSPWLLRLLVEYTVNLYKEIPYLIG